MIEQTTKIIFNRPIAPSIMLMGLIAPDISARAIPGQFIMLRVTREKDPLLRRPFSICAIQEDHTILILYKVVGQGTSVLAQTVAGDRLSVLGPLGNGYIISRNNKKHILVAGGIGLAPLIFLARTIKDHDFSFVAGYRSSNEIIPISEMITPDFDPGISIATDDGAYGHRGPVTDLLETALEQAGNIATAIYACGPLGMLKRVSAMAAQRNIPCQVSIETNMACGLGACQGCAVKASAGSSFPYYHVCKDGPVFFNNLLDWKNL
jgi:dihydroorotate dehydrogenase electron transfer subunit